MQSFPAALRIAQSVATLAGAQDSLASINTTLLSPNAIVAVTENNSLYMLRKASVATPSSPDIIAPAQGGTGRWYLYAPGTGASQFTTVDLVIPPLASQVGTQINIAVPGAVDNNDVVVFNVREGLTSGIILSSPRFVSAGLVEIQAFNGGAGAFGGDTITLRVAVLSSP